MENNPIYRESEKLSTEELFTGAQLSLDKHDYDKALELAKKALSSELNNPEFYLLISKAYEGLGSKDNAERFYKFYKLFA